MSVSNVVVLTQLYRKQFWNDQLGAHTVLSADARRRVNTRRAKFFAGKMSYTAEDYMR
jgi:hypothetical protein